MFPLYLRKIRRQMRKNRW